MRVLTSISKAIKRFNRWIGPTAAAESVIRDGGGIGGTHVDPLGFELLKSDLAEQGRSEEPRD